MPLKKYDKVKKKGERSKRRASSTVSSLFRSLKLGTKPRIISGIKKYMITRQITTNDAATVMAVCESSLASFVPFSLRYFEYTGINAEAIELKIRTLKTKSGNLKAAK
ncbi:MAG: hypothetical protein BWY43_00434 [candidate division WS2 bacterium ADurb.Bin280]|uniref:Uncharacterized protein n=1 Tax=candidate division WS2 bacterium ADurb.Bin280 TaxID=1852829 RepID=A0A1V5SE68_9BACT|nr:MAG: hypothetical protein BWY43_00434 [candidate division WS2 bacterium ADurb.Bin280]